MEDYQIEDLEYLGEGNANVIFRYKGSRADLQGMALRLRKHHPSSYTVAEHYQYLNDVVLPALGWSSAHVLSGELIEVNSVWLKLCQDRLQQFDQIRPKKFLNQLINLEERYGLTMRELKANAEQILLEFKPKWLTQSFDAPSSASLCRTCALTQARSMLSGQPTVYTRYCPLDLASGDPSRVRRAVNGLNKQRAWDLSDAMIGVVSSYFTTSNVIQDLRNAQLAARDNLALCMTLRDCSIFLMLGRISMSVEQLWIADLDRKSRKDRQEHWAAVEQSLIIGRYYYGRNVPTGEFLCVVPCHDQAPGKTSVPQLPVDIC